jgi:ribosomal protein S18 acetylase RimI-like enzyme
VWVVFDRVAVAMRAERDQPAIRVRRVRPEEYEDAGRVTADAYREFVPSGEDRDDWLEYLGRMADVAGRVERTHVLVAVDEGTGRVLGCVTIEEDGVIGDDDESLEPGASHIRMLGVDPVARGRGVGRSLMQAAIERSRVQGKRFVTLRTTPVMTSARALYASMGFELDPVHDLVFDNGFRLIAYRLHL